MIAGRDTREPPIDMILGFNQCVGGAGGAFAVGRRDRFSRGVSCVDSMEKPWETVFKFVGAAGPQQNRL